MSVRPLIAMYLLILCAVATGCAPSADPSADTKSLAAARNAAPPRKNAEEKAAEKRAAEERAADKKAAGEEATKKRAAEEKAAANSYVKVKVEVELRGVLTCTDEAATVSIVTPHFGPNPFEEVKWVLDFGEDKDMRAKAKELDGKTVLVKGSAPLQYKTIPIAITITSRDLRDRSNLNRGRGSATVLDVEPKVAVKSLVPASKE